jgi:hypothetical protein
MGVEFAQGREGCSFFPEQGESDIKGKFLRNGKTVRLLDEEIDRLGDGASRGILDRDDPARDLSRADRMEDLRDGGAGKSRSFWETPQGDKMGKCPLGSEESDGGWHGSRKLCAPAGKRGKTIRIKSIGLISSAFGFKKDSVKGRSIILAAALLASAGCLPAGHGPGHPAKTKPSPTPTPSPGKGPHIPWFPFLRKPEKPPPKASLLRDTGRIRQVSRDGSFAIVDLEPGVSVSVGEILTATASGHSPARAKVTDIQPPCFAVEVIEGELSTGDRLKR